MTPPLLDLHRVTCGFVTARGVVRAVEEVSLRLHHGETLGLVGESGCGKSTLARLAMRLIAPGSGSIRFDGIDLATARGEDLRRYRAAVQMVFQDPYAALNPRETIGTILEQPLIVHRRGGRSARRAEALAMLARVGLRPELATRYPSELSGGQRQRVGIARALMLQPRMLVCDEAVSALDVSVRSQVLNLLLRLRADHGLGMLFISHDLSVVRHLADRVAVMYLGRIVEFAPRDMLWQAPLHPYTRALMAATPLANPAAARSRVAPPLPGEVPSPLDPPPGCHFHPRCPLAIPRCRQETPDLHEATSGHSVACHLAGESPCALPMVG
ncbi:murein tripeptide ABC transporter/oligopeptide ABC transporter ATP binding subunit OppF [Rhodovastum atsumiense]|uniref:ATP-binding cassette domain-containing protein n=1 Tax=Rhodovastum atsumiense TaxID=504468 RepID=A0A5M6J361_9PROT|nr:oligopeptide/dipeptide ABC transporter ATP-binding protein [Rhodovastum atsumiense]KAA5614557.1 ATP-binding cassette domain-containing protein [Rhodovastum atsumiense]CAH2599954.1 murein tripeptide ABC transporter/oligopeptide ABC transporter ATP binding subunit OppF [Rhodovastum atsumiense]